MNIIVREQPSGGQQSFLIHPPKEILRYVGGATSSCIPVVRFVFHLLPLQSQTQLKGGLFENGNRTNKLLGTLAR